MKFVDLFAGLGGFRLAFDSEGYECVFTSEIDKIPSEMYKLIHNESEISGDIKKIEASDIPNHDVLIGGITCQGFSQNGKKVGFDHKTGDLFFEVLRIAEEKKPKYIVIENVFGLITNNKMKSITTIVKLLSDSGYSTDFTVLDSRDFNLPQYRRRVFIVAVLNHHEAQWELNDPTKTVNDVKRHILNEHPDVKMLNFPYVRETIKSTSLAWVLEDVENPEYIEFEDFITPLGDNKFRIHTGKKIGYDEFEAIPFETTIDYTYPKSKTRRGRVKQHCTKTLDQAVEVAVFDGRWFRRITTKETFRLQGFPDEIHDKLKEAGFSKNQLYARPSRSISIPIVKELAKSIKKFDEENNK